MEARACRAPSLSAAPRTRRSKLMAASLLTADPLTLGNVPRLADVRAMADLLKSFGVSVTVSRGTSLGEGDTIRLHAAKITSCFASYDMVRKMRASFQVLAPLLARHGEAKVSLPGGCAIGARPVNLHLDALAAYGGQGGAGGWLCAGAGKWRPSWGRDHLSLRFRRRHGNRVDGRDPGARDHRHHQRGPRAGDRGSLPMPDRDGGEHPGPWNRTADRGGREGIAWRRPCRHGRPHRGRHLRDRRRDRGRRDRAGGRAARYHRSTSRTAGADRRRSARHTARDRGARQGGRPDGGGYFHRALSRLSHRSAGPVHGPDDDRRRHRHHPGNHFRKPLHACAGTGAAGRRHPRRRRYRHRARAWKNSRARR